MDRGKEGCLAPHKATHFGDKYLGAINCSVTGMYNQTHTNQEKLNIKMQTTIPSLVMTKAKTHTKLRPTGHSSVVRTLHMSTVSYQKTSGG